MPITCPSAVVSVAVNAMTQTICVQGTVAATAEWLRRRLRVLDGPQVIQVIVINGQTNQAPAAPPAGTTTAVIAGTNWCAANVPVPAFSATSPGAPLTAIAWQSDAVGTVVDISVQPFYGLDSRVGGIDCCSGCVGGGSTSTSASGSSPPSVGMVLTGCAELLVAVPDGAHAGAYTAVAIDVAQWRVTVGPHEVVLALDETGTALLLTGPGGALELTSLLFEPFSATFVGDLLGATGEIVVTQG